LRCVIIESPYRGDISRNKRYARRCVRDCILRGESPIASHLLFTQRGILRDSIPTERKAGMEAGWAWFSRADALVVYEDYGISYGMGQGIIVAKREDLKIEKRSIGRNPRARRRNTPARTK
jgi:hypothetical protein